ncbi:hypothetical protein [Mucilaginibacter arboris]|uniref:Uncharacterized protein n=1 Tax=Mucilaginibacter arboris TaxID=2682090 RepID=A0A7K1STJ2_9SPHI|nr:hypothetical protein [Mucilaginibacter arboris]MVN20430.1 hypothetical protein [Mucilaginibacter arboris]
METKPKFFFDYIYYRMTKAYFKWDGRTGGTAIVAIMMIQMLYIIDVLVFILRVFYTRNQLKDFNNYGKGFIIIIAFILLIYNYRKYNGSYNKLRYYWKDESRTMRVYKGLLVIVSLILPWAPLILMGMFWK